jgi:hypothetical protein
LIVAGVFSLALGGCAGGAFSSLPGPGPTPTMPPGMTKIQHIVFIVQENRTVDDLFNGFPGADTVTSGKNSKGGTVDLQPVPLEAPYDPRHHHADFETDYNGGAMNGFDKEVIQPNPGHTAPPDAAFSSAPVSHLGELRAADRQRLRSRGEHRRLRSIA